MRCILYAFGPLNARAAAESLLNFRQSIPSVAATA